MTGWPVQVVHEYEGRPFWLGHSLYEMKLDASSFSETTVFKMTSPPNVQLTSPHRHGFDQILLVTKGLVISFVGEDPRTEHFLRKGSMIFLPAGTLEGFKTLDTPAEMYWFMMGDRGRSERFFALT